MTLLLEPMFFGLGLLYILVVFLTWKSKAPAAYFVKAIMTGLLVYLAFITVNYLSAAMFALLFLGNMWVLRDSTVTDKAE